ncbi:gliding motility lipoprotein GldH [Flavobacterium sp. MK4S-17]|jgi:gliding motility-associated lipoprotein GldH|uniref:gliding motility lipoprotein GldH n=1 Tax=Flavobacterium sp. MK4S-17 TaxID=2543737 RepID=UPI001356C8C9|nr:gliding motility lipoprotein GldH [Flavobacterium sp. MK4S-17]
MKRLLLFFVLIAFSSCEKTTVFSETLKNFSDNRWQMNDAKTFEFEVKKDIASADIELLFSHIIDPQYQNVPLMVTITNPDGTVGEIYLNLQLKDSSGKTMSECMGDICDLRVDLKEGIALTKGKYKITVHNGFPDKYLPNVLALGIEVKDKSK